MPTLVLTLGRRSTVGSCGEWRLRVHRQFHLSTHTQLEFQVRVRIIYLKDLARVHLVLFDSSIEIRIAVSLDAKHRSDRRGVCMMNEVELRVIGRHKGFVKLDLSTATVLDLKQAVARESGLAVGGLKLLSGGKQLKDDASTLAQCGVSPNKTIMVLRQDLSEQVQAEVGLNRRTEEVAQAASKLSARAARDIDRGGSGNAWGGWGRGGRGRRMGTVAGRTGTRNDLPQIELTNQVGESLTIPQKDSAALMEGMMLHRKGLACVARAGVSSAATVTKTTASGGDETVQNHPLSTGGTSPVLPPPNDELGAEEDELRDDASPVEAAIGRTSDGLDERKESAPLGGGHNEKEGERGYEDRVGDVSTGGGTQEATNSTSTKVARGSCGRVGVETSPEGGEMLENVSVGAKRKGKGKLKAAPPRWGTEEYHTPSATELRLVQREALGLLFKAEEAFRKCDPKYLECVDNYAYLCLDIVWLLFLMKDMGNLDMASRMLLSVERGFLKAHGPGLQRLTALKGEYCAEKLLYVRLHLLQGVVAFLQGDSGKASGLLIRASEESKALKPDPALAARLVQKWRTVKFEDLRPKVALFALRVGRNNLDAAWQYLESLRHRKDAIQRGQERRSAQRNARRYGFTANKKSFVDAVLVAQLTECGFPRRKAISALRRHNNDVEAALASLTAPHARDEAVSSSGNNDEALAILQSLGVPPDAACVALERAGGLHDALRDLGIDVPEGTIIPPPGRAGARSRASSQRTSSTGGKASDGERVSNDEDEEDDCEDEDRQEEGGDDTSGICSEEPTAEEKTLYEELAMDRNSQDEEGYLDISLQDEADAADMYLHLCRGNIPVAFDFDKIRAGITAVSAEIKHAPSSDAGRK